MSLLTAHCAIWHPNIDSGKIADALGLQPFIKWSLGDINPNSGIARDRTYLRFNLGTISKESLRLGIPNLSIFSKLHSLPEFYTGGGSIVVYLNLSSDFDEVHINRTFMKRLQDISAELVFR